MKTYPLESFEQVAWFKFKMPLIVVYEKPTDFPDSYVGRIWDLDKSTEFAVMRPTLEELRAAIPQERFVRLDRSFNDDPVIVEVWV